MLCCVTFFCESQESSSPLSNGWLALFSLSVCRLHGDIDVEKWRSPFISIVWCFRPYKPYIFWKLIIWWWQWPRQILTKRRRHEIRFYALLGLNIFQGSIFSRSEYFSVFQEWIFFRGDYFSGVNIYPGWIFSGVDIFQGLMFFRGEYFSEVNIFRSGYFSGVNIFYG